MGRGGATGVAPPLFSGTNARRASHNASHNASLYPSPSGSTVITVGSAPR